MAQESRLLIDAIAAAVTNKAFTLPEVDWQSFMQLAAAHGVLALVCDGLQKQPAYWAQVPPQMQKCLTESYMKAIYKDTQLEYRKDMLQQELEQAGVRHIFLKGAVLKYDYPIPALRTMSDLDVLVHVEDYGKIDPVAVSMGGKQTVGDGNHRNYSFPGGVAVEFHPNLLHHDTPVGTQINPGWQYAKQNSESYAMELTEEGIYLNTICHLANHFVAGGVGVRFVLDVWVSRNLRKAQPDQVFVEQELERFGLLSFARNIETLADCWFGQGRMTPVLEEMGEYILTSGSHGTEERAILNAMSIAGGRSAALWGKLFYSRGEMEDRFPWCKGKAWLLPAAWCARAYKAVTVHGGHIVRWSKGTGEVTKEQIRNQRAMLQRMGLLEEKK